MVPGEPESPKRRPGHRKTGESPRPEATAEHGKAGGSPRLETAGAGHGKQEEAQGPSDAPDIEPAARALKRPEQEAETRRLRFEAAEYRKPAEAKRTAERDKAPPPDAKVMKKRHILNFIYPLLTLAGILLIWWIAALIMDIEIILPSPWVTFREFFVLLGSAQFWQALGGTLLRSLIAFALSFVLAVGAALLSRLSGTARRLLEPLITFLRAVPTMAVILLLLIWTSASAAPVIVAMLVIFPTLYSALYAAFSGVDPELIEMSRVYRVPKAVQIRRLFLPAVLPALFESFASGFSLNLKLVVAAEALSQTARSVGAMMQTFKANLDISGLLALTVTTVIISFLSEFIIRLAGRLCTPWLKG